ncbi:MAG: class I SAM-dependent methyltransferase [Phormidesmis sp.]
MAIIEDSVFTTGEGWFEQEHDGKRDFCWMSSAARLQTASDLPSKAKVIISAAHPLGDRTLLIQTGTEKWTLPISKGKRSYVLELNRPINKGTDIALTCTPHFEPPGDSRKLGLMIFSIRPSPSTADISYQHYGIDPQEFYRDKSNHESDSLEDLAKKNNPAFDTGLIDLYDATFFKRYWIYSKVKPGAKVFDFGCGFGALACLKNKDCTLHGIDYSEESLQISEEFNHYDKTYCGSLDDFDLEDGTYDYVVSTDVFGHIEFADKNKTIQRLKKLLKPGGTMLHGIECGYYDYWSEPYEEAKTFVEVDGHIGMEDLQSIKGRFEKYFQHVSAKVRFDAITSWVDLIKQNECYGEGIDPVLKQYLSGFTFSERKAFDIASGIALHRMEILDYPSAKDTGGFLLLEASDSALSEAFASPQLRDCTPSQKLLDDNNFFLKGWLPYGGQDYRLGTNSCFFRFDSFIGEFHVELTLANEVLETPEVVFYVRKNSQAPETLKLVRGEWNKFAFPIEADVETLQLFITEVFDFSLFDSKVTCENISIKARNPKLIS